MDGLGDKALPVVVVDLYVGEVLEVVEMGDYEGVEFPHHAVGEPAFVMAHLARSRPEGEVSEGKAHCQGVESAQDSLPSGNVCGIKGFVCAQQRPQVEGMFGKLSLCNLAMKALEGLGVLVILLMEDQGHEIILASSVKIARLVYEKKTESSLKTRSNKDAGGFPRLRIDLPLQKD